MDVGFKLEPCCRNIATYIIVQEENKYNIKNLIEGSTFISRQDILSTRNHGFTNNCMH